MKELASRLSYRFMVLMACFALGTVAVGCGDDDDGPTEPDSGVDAGGRDGGGSGGRAGGGAGGTGGSRPAGSGGSDGDSGIDEGMDAG